MIYTAHFDSLVGTLLLAERNGGLIGLWMAGQKYDFSTVQDEIREQDTPVLLQTKRCLARYFAGEKPDLAELHLTPIGNAFRQEVWKILVAIPYGETVTYGEIARKVAVRMGKEHMSPQAVGGAVGHNPISILIPCHRVVGANGSLTGYAGGIGAKVKLLTHEGVDMTRFFVPSKGTAL